MNPTTLVMFSGGLDSTGMLWKLLNENHEIHVHHMNLLNVENRAKAEKLAVKNLFGLLKKIRDFTYSESTHQYPVFNQNFIWDSDMVSFIAGNLCLLIPSIKQVAIGMTASDEAYRASERIERANKIFSAFTTAKKIFPIQDMTKKQIYEMLPSEIRNATWSCRTPAYKKDGTIVPCNKCQTCGDMAKLKVTNYSSEVMKFI